MSRARDLANGIATLAPKESPAFTGTITAPNNSISGAFVTDENILIEFILIGGGGSGGIDRGSGGGAGGYIRKRTVVQKGVAYTIDIGNGGTAISQTQASVNGQNSTAFGYIALGGGGGGTYHSNTDASKLGKSGGSGGGCSNMSFGLGGGGVESQGNSGGNFNSNVANNSCGGGGGAGGQGQPASQKGGDGGIGIADDWEGEENYRAGGGGGASGSGTAGNGKSNGGNGNTGDNAQSASSATANSGSGGGGATGGGGTFYSGAGGSGICLVRNLATLGTATITGTGNETSTQGSYKLYKFIADGTITF